MSDWIQQNFPDIYRIGMQRATMNAMTKNATQM